MPLEIEVKIFVEEPDRLLKQLAAIGAEIIVPRVHERNQLFESPYQDFRGEGIVLRLRQDQKSKITFKSPAPQDSVALKARRELETTIGDYDSMDGILRALGYHHSLFYEKYRTVYHIDSIPDADIMVDELPFGTFVEVEGSPEAIESILDQLELAANHRIQANYAGLFEAIRHHHNLSDVQNVAFTEFEDIEIDTAIFEEL